MSEELFARVASALGERYGAGVRHAADGTWRSLVRTVLSGDRDAPPRADGRSGRAKRRGRAASDESAFDPPAPLTSPGETSAATVFMIEEALNGSPRSASRARLLKELGRWWLDHFGDDAAPEWSGSTEMLRDELRSLRGMGHELADRILLQVAGRSAWPLARASIRIACRHGWMDLQSDYDDWQSFFLRMAEESGTSVAELADRLHQVGRDHCGPRPRCDDCPLREFLPASGPIEPDGP